MLGKRFRRTTSMSQLGPGCNNHTSSEKSDKKAQGMQEYNTVCCVPHKAVVVRPLIFQEGDTQSEVVEVCGDTDCGGDANMMGHGFDLPHKFFDVVFTESPHEEKPPFQLHDEISPCFQVQTPSPLVPYQMGLWTPHLGIAKLQHISAEASISPIDFLDVCFFCKRRLKHERDIFIYRGDSAFCSEECRHRQILSDERRSLRGANKNKRGARASSNSAETAVAA